MSLEVSNGITHPACTCCAEPERFVPLGSPDLCPRSLPALRAWLQCPAACPVDCLVEHTLSFAELHYAVPCCALLCALCRSSSWLFGASPRASRAAAPPTGASRGTPAVRAPHSIESFNLRGSYGFLGSIAHHFGTISYGTPAVSLPHPIAHSTLTIRYSWLSGKHCTQALHYFTLLLQCATPDFKSVAVLPHVARAGRWESRIGVPGSKHIYLGLFGDEKDAARAYDRSLVRADVLSLAPYLCSLLWLSPCRSCSGGARFCWGLFAC